MGRAVLFVVDGGDVRVLRRVWAAVDRYASRRLCVFVVYSDDASGLKKSLSHLRRCNNVVIEYVDGECLGSVLLQFILDSFIS
ncbi:MAG: hypothetical protein QXR17_07775 [Candidatus Bathyarchaeia archaeon]